jgi:protein O-GlcNAc transferase
MVLVMLETDYKELEDLYAAGQDGKVIERASHLIASHPENVSLWKILGVAYSRTNDPSKALSSVRHSLSITPSDGETIWNFACLLDELGDRDSAIRYYEQYVCVDPHRWDGYAILAESVYGLERYEQSIVWATRAVGVSPGQISARLTKGSAQRKLARLDQAEAEFASAVSRDPYSRDALFNYGSILLERSQPTASMRMLDASIAIDPLGFGGYLHAGNAAREAGDLGKSAARYRRALTIDPNHDYLLGTCIELDLNNCNWRYLDEDIRTLQRQIAIDKRAAAGLTVLAVTDDPGLQLRAARIYAQSLCLPVAASYVGSLSASGKIRIGYFSADFRNHPTSHLIAGLLESHDRQRFEVFAFSLWSAKHDWMTERIERSVDRFVDVSKIDDVEVVRLCRGLGLDIAIDLMGYTEHCRPEVFARRCAPIQINYLGFIGSMGVPFIDYLIADRFVVDSVNRQCIDEKVIYLPECFQVNDSRREISPVKLSRDGLGLPSETTVYCCFNSVYKFNPRVFSMWGEILSRVPDSVLWLTAPDRSVEDRLRSEAKSRDLSPSRLIFSGRVPHHEYLARFALADLFLDTFPYNGGATSSDALWAGLPVLTLAGRSFVSRMGGSLLEALGLPELIARTPAEYVDTAVRLGLEKEKLLKIRCRLIEQKRQIPLYDVSRFARHFESGLTAAHSLRASGQAPADIAVPRLPQLSG